LGSLLATGGPKQAGPETAERIGKSGREGLTALRGRGKTITFREMNVKPRRRTGGARGEVRFSAASRRSDDASPEAGRRQKSPPAAAAAAKWLETQNLIFSLTIKKSLDHRHQSWTNFAVKRRAIVGRLAGRREKSAPRRLKGLAA
jgi:hypothetical protein